MHKVMAAINLMEIMASLNIVIIMLNKMMMMATLCTAASYTPNIVIITADDIGVGDVEFMAGSSSEAGTVTKWLNQYSNVSTVLRNYYVMPNGHSTRSALLTAKHPAILGTQFEVDDGTKRYGLDYKEALLPEYLKEFGYHSHAVGQWDLGFYSDDLLPTSRGYESFYGSYLTYGDYWTHHAIDDMGHEGLDLHMDLELDKSEHGTFKTELYARKAEEIIRNHNYEQPLHLYVALQGAQLKSQDICSKIPNDYKRNLPRGLDEPRRCHLALVNAVDVAYGRIMTALKNKVVLSKSIVIFTTTSGGPAAGTHNFNAASNRPFRGAKSTGWEGAVRGIAMVYYPRDVPTEHESSNCLFHVSDWIPTLLSMHNEAKGSSSKTVLSAASSLYGTDQFHCVYKNAESKRKDIVHFMYGDSASIMIQDRYKLVVNTDGHLAQMDEWYSSSTTSCDNSPIVACKPMLNACLFDLKNDPCERTNIADSDEFMLNELLKTMQTFNSSVRYCSTISPDSRGDPANFGNAWQPWINSINDACINSVWLSVAAFSLLVTLLIYLSA